MGEIVGKSGLEIEYDSVLRGAPGVSFVEVTARGRTVREPSDARRLRPVAGRTLQTTIDLPLQRFVDSMWRATPFLAARRGALLALRPDGAILAYYYSPTLHPHAWVGGTSSADHAFLRAAPPRPLVTRVNYGQ